MQYLNLIYGRVHWFGRKIYHKLKDYILQKNHPS